MTSETMTVERVLELIEAYGAEPGGWPEGERDAASALVARDPDQFGSALSDARALDQYLLSEAPPEPNMDLAAAILAEAPKATIEQNSIFGAFSGIVFPRGIRWPAGAALASLLMGLVGGYAYASGGVGDDQADAAYYAAFGVDSNESWLSLE